MTLRKILTIFCFIVAGALPAKEARIVVLGSCSGTEPYAGRHHTSWILETENSLYWFDAGEGCAHTAYVNGIDVRKCRRIFISHPHSDHVAGLMSLIACMEKMRYVADFQGDFPEILTPCPDQINKIIDALETGDGKCAKPVRVTKFADGCIYQDDELQVEAMHNTHLGTPKDGDWKSFSFRIHSPFGTIIFSGDVGDIRELETWLSGADYLLMETGHHDPVKVCQFLKDHPQFKGKLVLLHHGRKILNAKGDALRQKCCAVLGRDVIFADDAQVLTGTPLTGHAIIHKK